MEEINDTQDVSVLQARLERLSNINDAYREWKQNHLAQINTLRDYLINNVDTLGAEEVSEIAAIFDLTLTKEVTLTVTVELTMTATVPLGFEDWREFGQDLDIDVTTNGDYDIEHVVGYITSVEED